MKTDPLAPRIVIDYVRFCGTFGPFPFGDFIALWHAADVMEHATVHHHGERRDVRRPSAPIED
jgi:hypothetical protein